jgi:hypothetical protein
MEVKLQNEMTKFYCVKCKKETETADEVQDMTNSGRYRLHGNCTVCGKHKNTFTGKDWVIKKKSKKETAQATAKKKKAEFIRQCKDLGLEIFQSDQTCKNCVSKCLDGNMKRMEATAKKGGKK